MDSSQNQTSSVIEFPCRFPIKAMGRATDSFDKLILGIVQRHCMTASEDMVKTRSSRGGKYLSVTVIIEAQSQQQLDNIYLDMTAHSSVLMAF